MLVSAQTLINVLASQDTYIRLRALIKLSVDKTFTRRQIYDEVKKLGLKPYEFARICKLTKEPDLLYNELSMLELIADNLLDN
jgi:hypothetical protein